jgi:hypothetical protein
MGAAKGRRYLGGHSVVGLGRMKRPCKIRAGREFIKPLFTPSTCSPIRPQCLVRSAIRESLSRRGVNRSRSNLRRSARRDSFYKSRSLCAEPHGGANEKLVLPFHRSPGGDQTQLSEPTDCEPLGARFNGNPAVPPGADNAGWVKTGKPNSPLVYGSQLLRPIQAHSAIGLEQRKSRTVQRVSASKSGFAIVRTLNHIKPRQFSFPVTGPRAP